VAPRSPNVDAFAKNLVGSESWLTPFEGFGPNNFLVGNPEFSFEAYHGWIDARFPPSRFRQLRDKMDPTTLFAVGAFIQSLGQNPGLEQELQSLGTQTHIYVGTGIGNIITISQIALAHDRAQRAWDRFWAELNPELQEWKSKSPEERPARLDVPPEPETRPFEERADADRAWWHYWAGGSPDLRVYLQELAEIEALAVEGDVETGKMSLLKEKQRRFGQLQKRWGAPPPPRLAVTANVVWNLHNTPAAQISMLGKITGLAFSPVAACSTFGVALKLAMDAIDRGEAKAVVVGATDPPPHPLSVGGFYSARVVATDGTVSKPLTGMRGTHVAGGSALWIVGDLEYFTAKGFRPLGMEPVAVGVSSDADHIITPSVEGPTQAMLQAFRGAGIQPDEIGTWDLHATATPGDYQEVHNLRSILPDSVLVTARKGTFGHGMSVSGGWELTAQYLGYERGELFPTPLAPEELNKQIAALHESFVCDKAVAAPDAPAGKLSMGVGGINACIISRPWKKD
jgi:3-oxoacyl-[acyl-carrier-protein] synthase II